MYPVLNDNCFFLPFFYSLITNRQEEKENEVAKPVLNQDAFEIQPFLVLGAISYLLHIMKDNVREHDLCQKIKDRIIRT